MTLQPHSNTPEHVLAVVGKQPGDPFVELAEHDLSLCPQHNRMQRVPARPLFLSLHPRNHLRAP